MRNLGELAMFSILMSNGGKRPALLHRCLTSIENSLGEGDYEVVVAQDNLDTTESLELLKGRKFKWKIVLVDNSIFTEKTGIKHFFNNPTVTNNAAFVHRNPASKQVFLMGNEIIAYKDVFKVMLSKHTDPKQLVLSTTFDIPESVLGQLDKDGTNVDSIIGHCTGFPLASLRYHSDVTNYISLCSASLWEYIGGYDERLAAGIAGDDSDFVRRCRVVDGFEIVRCGTEAVSLHQFHGGKNVYYDPKEEVIKMERWNQGLAINRIVYDAWDGQSDNKMPWKMAEHGVVEIIEG